MDHENTQQSANSDSQNDDMYLKYTSDKNCTQTSMEWSWVYDLDECVPKDGEPTNCKRNNFQDDLVWTSVCRERELQCYLSDSSEDFRSDNEPMDTTEVDDLWMDVNNNNNNSSITTNDDDNNNNNDNHNMIVDNTTQMWGHQCNASLGINSSSSSICFIENVGIEGEDYVQVWDNSNNLHNIIELPVDREKNVHDYYKAVETLANLRYRQLDWRNKNFEHQLEESIRLYQHAIEWRRYYWQCKIGFLPGGQCIWLQNLQEKVNHLMQLRTLTGQTKIFR